MSKLKNNISVILIAAAMLIGLSLLLYPSISNAWNETHQSHAIVDYIEDVSALDENDYNDIMEKAEIYNNSLTWKAKKYIFSDKDSEVYNSLININNTGIMGYVDIPAINCKAPIYHGTENSVLQVGVGHLEWSSLPIGGESSHCVLMAHRGLTGARLFTDLDKMRIGDTFTLNVLDEVLIYEVDDISVIEPKDVDSLNIINEKDYCTLITCTPYGVNTHRLLVRGVRVNSETKEKITADAEHINISPLLVCFIPIGVLIIVMIVISKQRNKAYADISAFCKVQKQNSN